MKRYIGHVGFTLILIGTAAMDGNQIVAAVLTLGGLALVYADYLRERKESV